MPLLVDVALGRSARRFPAYWLLTNILCGHHGRVAATGMTALDEDARAIADSIAAHVEAICKALSAKPPAVRAAAAQLLGFLPTAAEATVPALLEAAAATTHLSLIHISEPTRPY